MLGYYIDGSGRVGPACIYASWVWFDCSDTSIKWVMLGFGHQPVIHESQWNLTNPLPPIDWGS